MRLAQQDVFVQSPFLVQLECLFFRRVLGFFFFLIVIILFFEIGFADSSSPEKSSALLRNPLK